MKTNSLMIIYPYYTGGTWVFDDSATGLVREPFVSGAEKIISKMSEHIKNAHSGIKLIFSANDFPGSQVKLDRVMEEFGGNWYREPKLNMNGWLCPALFKYFDSAPKHIYAKCESLST